MLDPKLAVPLLEYIPVGIVVWRLDDPADDRSLTLAGFNPAAERLLKSGFPAKLGQRIYEAFPMVDPKRVAIYAELARKGGQVDMGESSYGAGEQKQILFVGAAAIGDHHVAVIIENATEMKRVTTFLDAIIENIPNMVFVKEAKELRFERFNRAGEQLLGMKREQLLGKNDYDFFPAEQAKFFQERDRAALRSSVVEDIPEEPIQTAAGQRWLHTRKVPIVDADGVPRYLLGISEDITERKAADEKMLQLVAQLKESNAELDGFTYSVSHDLRAPLRAVDGFSRMLLEDHGDKLGDEGRRVAQVINKNAVKMGQLIDDLLAFARLQRKQLAVRQVDMNALARDAVEETRAAGRDIEVRVGQLLPVPGDAALLKQVWLNLLSNAVKYTRSREKAVIEVSCVRRGDELVYTVKDNGVGYDARYQSKLFGVFQRLHTEAEYEGTGVGLALVQRIVRRHGGWVGSESMVGQGATFMFGLPEKESE